MSSNNRARHGTALIERVIDTVTADPERLIVAHDVPAGRWLEGDAEPMPDDLLATTSFPSGRPLSPSLRRWLAFDTGMLRRFGWFDSGYRFTPRPMSRLATDTFGPIGEVYDPLARRFEECFLLPGGSDSRRVLVTAEPDDQGEYAVLALDADDIPCIELMYPGFDVYLGDTAGVVNGPATKRDFGMPVYSALLGDPDYGPRMLTHARNLFAGRISEDFSDW